MILPLFIASVSSIALKMYYNNNKKPKIPNCDERNYRIDLYKKTTVLMSLNEAYRLSVQNNTLECIYVDVKNHTVKTIWSKELPKNGNSIVGNQFGQLSILDENDNEIFIYPSQPLFNTYQEYFYLLSNSGELVAMNPINNNIYWSESMC